MIIQPERTMKFGASRLGLLGFVLGALVFAATGLFAATGCARTQPSSDAAQEASAQESPAQNASAQEQQRPNIVVILADDLGFSDLGSYGSEIPTPHLDRLARQGMRFSNFYVTPRCAPTRASLLTGLYNHRAGMGHMPGGWELPRRVQRTFGSPHYQKHLRDRAATLAEVLKERAGYRTGIFGKWHLSTTRAHWPTRHGFDRFYGVPSGGGFYFWPPPSPVAERKVVAGNAVTAPAATDWRAETGWHSTEAFAARAARFVEDAAGDEQPFFLYLASIAPHYALQAFPSAIAEHEGDYRTGWDQLRRRRYERLTESGLLDSARAPLPERDAYVPAWDSVDNKERWDRKMAIYAAQVQSLDRRVGQVLDALDRRGERENTLVLFLSDNGACAEDMNRSASGATLGGPRSFVSYDRPWAHLSSTPFRGFKQDTYEGGIASPLIARWPGRIPEGASSDQVGHVIDLMPTLLDAAGATYPDSLGRRDLLSLDGRSLLPALEGEGTDALPERTLFWEHEGNRAVRRGRWKAVSVHGYGWALFDMKNDRTETTDLSEKRPRKVEQLARRYRQWADEVGVGDWSRIAE